MNNDLRSAVMAFDTPLERLLALLDHCNRSDQEWMSALTISKRLQASCGVAVHWRTIDAVFQKNRGVVTRRRRMKKWEYSILEEGVSRLRARPDSVSFVDPAGSLQATRELHEILANLQGIVRVCDPYLDKSTIEHLEACPSTEEIRVLSMNVSRPGPLRRILAAAKTAGFNFTVRVASAKVLHDRYVIDDKQLLVLGTSLNGFGKKQSFVVRAGQDMRTTMLKEFDKIWDTSADLQSA